MKDFSTFSRLHNNTDPLIIANVWDAGSALFFEANGFKAVATSSLALAHSMGYKDGQDLPFETLLAAAKNIYDKVSIPLSVDIERGYGETDAAILKNIEKLSDAGIAGINIEDGLPGGGLSDINSFQRTIGAIAEQASKEKSIFIHVRTDAYLQKDPGAFDKTMERIKAYEAAGASGIFIPYLVDVEEMKQITAAVKIPVSVFFCKPLPAFKDLAAAGIKRVSMGSGFYKYVYNAMQHAVSKIKEDGSAISLF